MWSKLFKGELSLATTFWKFGILGLVILHYALKMTASLLGQYLKGRSIYDFFMHHFHIVYTSKLSLWWTLCYMAVFGLLIFYSYRIVVAVWRSASHYDKSIWLANLAKIGILFAVGLVWYPIVSPYLG